MFLEIDFDQVIERGPRPRDRTSPTPFRTAPRPKKEFGRKSPPTRNPSRFFPKFVPFAGAAFIGADLADQFLPAFWVQDRFPAPATWYIAHTCPSYPPQLPYQDHSGQRIHNCSGGQVPISIPPYFGPWGRTIPANSSIDTIFLSQPTFNPSRAGHRRTYWRVTGAPKPAVTPIEVPSFTPFPNPPTDPNIMRWEPGTSEPLPFRTDPRAGTPEPIRQFEWQSTPPGRPPSPSHTSTAPRGNVKEKKTQSRAARIGVFLWQAFDTVSELSEIVDAFYEALPDEAKDKHGCEGGRLGDKLGQYGIDAADCKAVALWENWDKLDTREALMGVMKNVMEDMAIGQMHQLLSKLYPPGISIERTYITTAINQLGLELAIATALEDVFEAWGI